MSHLGKITGNSNLGCISFDCRKGVALNYSSFERLQSGPFAFAINAAVTVALPSRVPCPLCSVLPPFPRVFADVEVKFVLGCPWTKKLSPCAPMSVVIGNDGSAPALLHPGSTAPAAVAVALPSRVPYPLCRFFPPASRLPLPVCSPLSSFDLTTTLLSAASVPL
jgi:hypothetical protein